MAVGADTPSPQLGTTFPAFFYLLVLSFNLERPFHPFFYLLVLSFSAELAPNAA
jgi:hypothetical protein